MITGRIERLGVKKPWEAGIIKYSEHEELADNNRIN